MGLIRKEKGSNSMRVIAGKARRLPLKTIEGLDTRPTTDRIKETLFNILQNDLYDIRFLDIFSGSGGIGIEALSRGAKEAVFVDARREAIAVVRENLEKTRLLSQARLVCADYLAFLSGCGETFDLIFLDQPYAEIFLENALNRISEIDILRERGIIICERPIEKQLSAQIPGLYQVKNYRYGKTAITLYRRGGGAQEAE